MSKKIYIIVGSTRPGRVGRTIADWFYEQTQIVNSENVKFEIVDLADWNLPLFDEPIIPRFSPGQNEHSKKWTAKIADADGYIIVTPEYNHSIPASLKNALDYVYEEWRQKPVAFVTYGWHGSEMAIKHLTDITNLLEMRILPEQVTITFNQAMFNEQYQLTDPQKDLTPHVEDAAKVIKSFM